MRSRVVLQRLWCVVLAALLGVGMLIASGPSAGAYPVQGSYKDAPLQNCPDPATTKLESGGTTTWYLYCTTGPINDKDKTAGGGWARHLLPMYKSTNLIDWSYVGDAFSKRLKWASTSDLWAPEIKYFNGKYYLYYTVAESTPRGARTGQNSAIGVATSTSPTGPWTDSGGPVVEAQTGRWVFDPFVISDSSGQPYIFYGSYSGGLSARKLSSDRLKSDKASETRISVGDRYEGAWIQKRGDHYYLFASSTSCCNDELTGYSVFAGRSTTLVGPYLDRQGVSFLDSRVGGTPVLSIERQPLRRPGTHLHPHRLRRQGLGRLPRRQPGRPALRWIARLHQAGCLAGPDRLARRRRATGGRRLAGGPWRSVGIGVAQGRRRQHRPQAGRPAR